MSEEAKITFHQVIDDGWVHTHGMDRLNLPELEIRNVPPMFAESAAHILNTVCDYFKESQAVVKVGVTMAVSPRTAFKFAKSEPIEGSEGHYESERWELVGLEPNCECCGDAQCVC